jgi:AraC-like DNA-binding protein
LIVGVDAEVCVSTAEGQVRGSVVVVPKNQAHSGSAEGATFCVILDADGFPHADAHSGASGITPLAGRVADRIVDALRAEKNSLERSAVILALAEECSAIAFAGAVKRPMDRRVARFMDAMRADLMQDPKVALANSKISLGHFTDLFSRDVGMPFRRWRLWRRLVFALSRINAGVDFASAAKEAGFSDQAHFSRVCREGLGFSPRQL